MKLKYEGMELEIIRFESEDVIATSCTGNPYGDTCSGNDMPDVG